MRIGLFLNNLDEEYQISVYRGVEDATHRLGIDLLCVQGETLSRYRESADGLFPSRTYLDVDGVLLLSSVVIDQSDLSSFPELNELFGETPCVSIGERVPGTPSIVINSRHSMEKLMDHLIEFHGYRRFLYVGGPANHLDNAEREGVFRRSIDRARERYPDMSGQVENGAFHETSGSQILRKYLREHHDMPLDVVVAANDSMAIGAKKALDSHPEVSWHRCAVTGFDDIPRARHEVPALTTVRQPLHTLGEIAVRTLHRLITGSDVPPVTTVDSELRIRESCGCDSARLEFDPDALSLQERMDITWDHSLRIEEHLRHVSLLGQRLITADSLTEMIDHLRDFLDNIDAHTYYLLLYPEPCDAIPSQAQLVYERSVNGEVVRLDDEETVVLESFFSSDRFRGDSGPISRSIYHLISGNERLGMAVYEAEEYTQLHMCSSAVFLANTVKRLHILDDEKRRAKKLEEQVALRTRDLLATNQKLQEEAQRRIAVEAEVLRISEMERKRFSLDLHDDICQRLAGISVIARSHPNVPETKELAEMIEETLQQTRRYAHDSFPVELGDLGLNEALQSLCRKTERQSHSVCTYSWDLDGMSPLAHEGDINIYRIVQEALQNAIKHADPSSIHVSVRLEGDRFVASVSDDGVGSATLQDVDHIQLSRSNRPRGLGLRSMQYRAHQLGAEYVLTSSEEGGTLVEVRVPINSDDEPLGHQRPDEGENKAAGA
jgi:signal transduction histidine kinase/DNA-binding LacI/PurR family transcriptional regulator